MRFVYLDSRFTLHASSPRSVTLTQLRFTSLAVVSLREDLHLQDRAHAGRTKKPPEGGINRSAAWSRGSRVLSVRAAQQGRCAVAVATDAFDVAGHRVGG